ILPSIQSYLSVRPRSLLHPESSEIQFDPNMEALSPERRRAPLELWRDRLNRNGVVQRLDINVAVDQLGWAGDSGPVKEVVAGPEHHVVVEVVTECELPFRNNGKLVAREDAGVAGLDQEAGRR